MDRKRSDRLQRMEEDVFKVSGDSSKIHILGTGNLGNFVAHSLSRMADPPSITLLLHQPHKFQQWFDEGKSIEFMHDGITDYRDGFDVEYSGMQYRPDPRQQFFTGFDRTYGFLKQKEDWTIEKLVVTTSALHTVSALRSVRWRLGPGSTICFLNHNMGVVEHVNNTLFRDQATRPRYIIGMSSHGLYPTLRNFGVLQAGQGKISLSAIPTGLAEEKTTYTEEENIDQQKANETLALTDGFEPTAATEDIEFSGISGHGDEMHLVAETEDSAGSSIATSNSASISTSTKHVGDNTEDTLGMGAPDNATLPVSRMSYGWTTSCTTLMKTLTRCDDLVATGLPYSEMKQKQWEKLAVDSVINTLSVVFDCSYSKLLGDPRIKRLMHDLLWETVRVVHSLPEVKRDAAFFKTFTRKRLLATVTSIVRTLGNNTSPDTLEVRKGGRTDVLYVNGYIVKRGAEVGVTCRVHSTMMDLVRAKSGMKKKSGRVTYLFGNHE